jgi:pSer/pThr/pTyr-binding forkhead associated (FHA) protein
MSRAGRSNTAVGAYGRLDVYRPEGPIDTFPLDKPTVGVGRQPGNDIILDIAGVSRYHFVIELRGEAVYLIDKESQNGTYVDGMKIAADKPHPLREGEEIQAGDARIVFHSSLQSDIPTSEAQRVESVEATYTVDLDDAELTVTPGAHIQTIIKIHNTGNLPDTYEVQIIGLPKEWTRLDRLEIDLPPGQSTSVVLSIKPTRRPESTPGVYKATIRVLSHEYPESTVEVEMQVNLRPYSGFGMVMGTPRISEGQTFEVYTQNQGSGLLPLSFVGVDPSGRFEYDLQPASVTLNAGEKRTIHGTIRSKQKGVFNGRGEYRFDVIARARDASGFQVPISGVYVEKGGLPAWLPYAVLGGGGLAVFLAIVLLAVILPPILTPPTPTPTATLTPTTAPTITPVQVDIATFTPPPTETFTPSPSPTVTETLTLVPSATPDTSTATLTATPTSTVQAVQPDSGVAPAAPVTATSFPIIAPTVPTETPVGAG